MKSPPSPKENKLRKTNRKITLTGKKAIKALQELEFMIISLRKIEDHDFYKKLDSPGQDQNLQAQELSRFISENNYVQSLSSVRRIISERFDSTLGDDDMGDTERAMEHLVFWEKPGD
ncbi:hypothetical protein [Pseudomonas sp. RC10]|uniref:hypothetical protein n=1 Tax=Pseudomonas bambusae TaxID=3139142 RepID=UPI003138DFE4